MADGATVAAALRSAFDSAFATAEPTVQILGDNEKPLGKKTGTTVPNPATGEWVRISIQLGPGEITGVNEDISIDTGRIIVMIFTPLGTGTARAYAIRDKVRDIFQGQRIGDAYCRATQTTGFGGSPDNLWFQLNASTAFRFESTPA